MPIIVGSTVKLKADDTLQGRVLVVGDDTATWVPGKTGVERTDGKSALELVTTWSGTYSNYQPDLRELLQNVLAYGAVNGVLSKQVFNKDLWSFAAIDGVYELIGKAWLKQVEFMSEKGYVTDAASKLGFINGGDFANAGNKTISCGIIDVVYRLAMKQGIFNKFHMVRLLKMAAAFYLSNVYERNAKSGSASSFKYQ